MSQTETADATAAAPVLTELHQPQTRPPADGEHRVAFAATWDEYQAVARAVGDQSVRLAYDGRWVELMSPSYAHEDYKVLAACLVRILAAELGVPSQGAGSTRWTRAAAERAVEADESFFLTAASIAAARRHDWKADPEGPAPDLAIEMDLSPSRLDRPSIYQALGVPEVWRFDGETCRIDRLGADGGTYEPAAASGFFGIEPAEVAGFLLSDPEDDAHFARSVTEWTRAVLIPRRAKAHDAGPTPGPV